MKIAEYAIGPEEGEARGEDTKEINEAREGLKVAETMGRSSRARLR
ncbi:MAG: hypothetical protein WB952_11880 [Terriglobales bacterium]